MRLAARFDHIIVYEVSESNVNLARTSLRDVSNCTFLTAELENTAGLEPASVDMYFAANVMHFTDIDLAMEAVAYQSKPGGSSVAASLSNPVSEDE